MNDRHGDRIAHIRPPPVPRGVLLGVATSAYQIEGAWNEDGKGPSIWDTYAHTPGNIANGGTGDVANDHYHRYKQDVALLRSIGATAYRLSTCWPRIFPEGTASRTRRGWTSTAAWWTSCAPRASSLRPPRSGSPRTSTSPSRSSTLPQYVKAAEAATRERNASL